MEITHDTARRLLRASRARETGVASPPHARLVKALASVVAESQITDDTAGVSWIGTDDEFNALLLPVGRFVHARIQGERASAISYRAQVAALEAADIDDLPAYGELDWRVMTWHVTLTDGAVISLIARDSAQAHALAGFVHDHLMP
jgi:hypothetical protein